MFKRFLNAIIESRQLHANALVADILKRYPLEKLERERLVPIFDSTGVLTRGTQTITTCHVDMQLMTPPTGEIFKVVIPTQINEEDQREHQIPNK